MALYWKIWKWYKDQRAMKHFCFNSVWSFRLILSCRQKCFAGGNLILFCFAEGHHKNLKLRGDIFWGFGIPLAASLPVHIPWRTSVPWRRRVLHDFWMPHGRFRYWVPAKHWIFWQFQERRKHNQIFQVIHDMDECMHEFYNNTKTYRYVIKMYTTSSWFQLVIVIIFPKIVKTISFVDNLSHDLTKRCP